LFDYILENVQECDGDAERKVVTRDVCDHFVPYQHKVCLDKN